MLYAYNIDVQINKYRLQLDKYVYYIRISLERKDSKVVKHEFISIPRQESRGKRM